MQAMGVEAATELLEGLGFEVETEEAGHLPRPRLRLRAPTRVPARRCPKGSTITLFLSDHLGLRVHAEQTRRTSLLASAALLALAACWGSTFFMIKDLLERMPTLDFLALRFAIASLGPAGGGAEGARPALPRRPPARDGPRPALRRRADPPDRRPGAHPGEHQRLRHRPVRRVHPAAGRRDPAHPDPADHLGGRRRSRRSGSACSPSTGSASATASSSPWRRRCSTRCTSSGSARGRPPRTPSA